MEKMKIPTLWALVLMGGVVLPPCIAMPAKVSDDFAASGASWVIQAFLAVTGLVLIMKLLAMCTCGDKPQTSDHQLPGDTNESQPAVLVRQQSHSSGDNRLSQGGVLNPPLPSTPNGPPYQNIHGNGEVQPPPSPKRDGSATGSASPMARTGTIDRQLPAIPANMGTRNSIDYDDDYDTIRTGKDDDFDGTYASVKDKNSNIPPIDEAEGDYADVPEMGRRVMPTNFGDYADVKQSKAGSGQNTASGSSKVAQTSSIPAERKAPRAEPEPDISDAEYAVVDMKDARNPSAAAVASTSQNSTEPYQSVKVGEEQATVGSAKFKKHHGYAKIGDVRVEGAGADAGVANDRVSGGDQAAGSSPPLSPGSPLSRSPAHSTGSPTHQQRSLPDVDDSSLGAVGGIAPGAVGVAAPGLGADGPQLVVQEQLLMESSPPQASNKKEPRYSQVSARESLARVRARQMEQSNQAAEGDSGRLHYQVVDERSAEEGDDHNGLYESVDYQNNDKTENTSPSFDVERSNSNTLPPRRGRVYEEINDRDGSSGSNDAAANIEPYAVVEPIARRKTAPSKISSRTDSSGSDFSELYARVDKQPKLKRGVSADDKVDEQDFDELYAKVNKKKAPKKVQSFDDATSDSLSNDGMYAEVKRPPSVGTDPKSANNAQAAANNRDFDDSYQSIDDVRADQKIDEKAKKVGMVHIDEVQAAPVVWTRPEHTYASVDTAPQVTQNGQSDHSNQRQAQHNYEVVDKKQNKKGKQKKKSKGKEDKKSSSKEEKEKSSGKSSPKKQSPTHLDKRQLELLADKTTKETDL